MDYKNMNNYTERILDHYISVWKREPDYYLWDKGPFDKLPSDFRVLEFRPGNSRDMWTYATCGMSQPEDKKKVEVHIFSSTKDSTLIELLTAVAYYHRKKSKLDLNHTINFGRPWQNVSKCEFGFLSLPYLDGPDLENLILMASGDEVKFYWIIPVTAEEVRYKITNGVDRLEEKFESGFNYLDWNRGCVV